MAKKIKKVSKITFQFDEGGKKKTKSVNITKKLEAATDVNPCGNLQSVCGNDGYLYCIIETEFGAYQFKHPDNIRC